MSIGPAVRHRLGPLETPAAEVYRRMFVNLDDLARRTAAIVSHPVDRILEIGCGDGAVADRLVRTWPAARYTGIDVAPNPGRRYRGPDELVEFTSISSAELRDEHPDPFDLIMVVDVLHHVPESARVPLLEDAAAMLTPGGTLLIKEWRRDATPPSIAGRLADRYISGDREAAFMSGVALGDLLRHAAPKLAITHQTAVRPWACNVLLGLRGHCLT